MVTPALDAVLMVGAPVLAASAVGTVSAVKFVCADANRRAAMRKAWAVRRTWSKTAVRVGLFQTDKSAKVGQAVPLSGELRPAESKPQLIIPSLIVRPDDFGLVISVKVVGRIGLEEWTAAADYLAHAWEVRSVSVEHAKPGWLRVRALLRDPLTEPMAFTPVPADSVDLTSWHIGRDSYGEPVFVRSSGVSGVVVAGLAGFGKTSALNARISQLAVSAAVQFVFIDGKGGPDYDDLFCRAWLSAKDDPEQVLSILKTVHALMTDRQGAIKTVLGVKNMWHLGPSAAWPLVLVVIDEAHTFFREIKNNTPEAKARNAVNAEIARLVEELVRKGRNVGIQIVLATQKSTGDAIPTFIRDNCQVAISFAQRTSEASIATLGSDISDYPHAHPRRLVDPAYIGVATMQAEGRPGFTLVRTPYASDELAARIAADTAHLVADPAALLVDQLAATATIPAARPAMDDIPV